MIEQARPQPNAWACGPASLRNAMLVYDHQADVRGLMRASETDCCHKSDDPKTWERDGHCEHGLQNAARDNGFRLDHRFTISPTQTYKGLRESLPALLAVDHFSHWVTAIRATTRHVWIIDPARDEELHQRLTWRQLLLRLAYGLPGNVAFHFYPLVQL